MTIKYLKTKDEVSTYNVFSDGSRMTGPWGFVGVIRKNMMVDGRGKYAWWACTAFQPPRPAKAIPGECFPTRKEATRYLIDQRPANWRNDKRSFPTPMER